MGSPPNGLPLRKAVLATASVSDGSAKAEKKKTTMKLDRIVSPTNSFNNY